ncbi:MAG: PepSY domain-containing protein [Saccharospirillaceae bacterium]|nr:PepSY domain-containing protein [Saccharospirillaceae bacterium]MCD8532423.1 PepSY domain-containing protein [Saccharospirillaceae bacterium]
MAAMIARKTLVSVHLYLASFFAPMIIIMAVSGGLYLFGIKGTTLYTDIGQVDGATLNAKSPTLNDDVQALLKRAGIDTGFEYVKDKGNSFYTRPTSREHYLLQQQGDTVVIKRGEPDLQATLMELHKGHGPSLFKWLEKIFALGLVLIMASGLYLGLQSPMLKNKTLALSGAGLVVFLLLALS